MRRYLLIIVLCCAGLGLVSAQMARAETVSDLTVTPQSVDVGLFFSGEQITITGELAASEDAMLEIIGPEVNSLFDVKGRIGPFWMTREKVDLENAPSLYILLVPAGQQWAQKADALNLGIDNLRQQVAISHSETAPDDIFHMFVKLKRFEKLYAEVQGAVAYEPLDNGRRKFMAMCYLPSSTAGGTYRVQATAIANGKPIGQASQDLVVRQVGFVQTVNSMATNRRLTYGVAAVLIALFAGALMGLIFKGGGGH